MRLPLLCAILLVACSNDGADRGRVEVMVRDSAGIAIRDYTADVLATAPVFALDTTPLAEVRGSADDIAADISTLSLHTFTTSGLLVAVDNQASQVVLLPPDGAAPVRVGTRGSGPGEFRYIADIRWLAGDSLVVVDGGNARLTVMDPAGTMVRTISTGPLNGRGTYNLAGRLDGRWIGSGVIHAGEDESSEEMHLKASAMTEDGTPAVQLFRTREDSSDVERRIASGSQTSIAIRSGTFTRFPELLVAGPYLAHLDAGRGHVILRGADGTIRGIHRLGWPRVAVTSQLWERYVDDQLARMMGSGVPAEQLPPDVRQQMLRNEHPDSLPIADRMRVTPSGTLWIERYPTPGDSAWEAVAIAVDGTLLGRLTGVGKAPSLYGDDRVAFRVEDEDGIATVRVHRLNGMR